jgi:nucleoid-associated protein YgaU
MPFETYIVKHGDTLTSIAREKMGRAGAWKELFWVNARTLVERRPIPGLVNPNFIKPGDELEILTGVELRKD